MSQRLFDCNSRDLSPKASCFVDRVVAAMDEVVHRGRMVVVLDSIFRPQPGTESAMTALGTSFRTPVRKEELVTTLEY